jgi:ABC-type glycerol-3-phosphate transport system substrate-binding protein
MNLSILRSAKSLLSTALLASVAVAGCGTGATAEQLTWCAENQDEVGRAAQRLGLISDPGSDPISFSQWKDNSPNEYERACIDAYQEA